MHEHDFEPVELTNVILLESDGKILLQNQHKYAEWQGWVMPGGHVDPGESFVQSAIREMREETGLTILDPKLVGIKQFPKDFPVGVPMSAAKYLDTEEPSGDPAEDTDTAEGQQNQEREDSSEERVHAEHKKPLKHSLAADAGVPMKRGRYIVLFFKATRYSGELNSSDEGEMRWFTRSELKDHQTVNDFYEMLRVFDDDVSEFQYTIEEDGSWVPHHY